LLRAQHVVGQAEATARKQLLAIAIVGKGTRLAHQPVDDMPVVDALLAPTVQPRQPFDLPLAVPDFQHLGVQPHLDPLADEPAGHRVDVAGHMNRAPRIDPDPQPLARLQPPRRQRPQHRQLLGQTRLPAGIQLGEHLTHEHGVGFTAGEVPAAPQHQRLVQGPFELAVALLDIAVLVAVAGLNRLPPHAIVPQQCLITLRERLAFFTRRDGRGQPVGPMDLGNTAQLPHRVLEPFAETLQALGETDRPRLPVGVRQHEVVDQMRKRHAGNGDAQAAAMGEIRGAQPTRLVDLREDHFLGGSVQRSPALEPALQGPQLVGREPARMLPLQFREQGGGQQAGVHTQQFLQVRPNVAEGVRSGAPIVFHAWHLTGQLAELPVFARGLLIDADFVSRLRFGQALPVEATEATYLLIGDHPKPPCGKGLRIAYAAQLTGKSSCR
jgi:hypothetical protein